MTWSEAQARSVYTLNQPWFEAVGLGKDEFLVIQK